LQVLPKHIKISFTTSQPLFLSLSLPPKFKTDLIVLLARYERFKLEVNYRILLKMIMNPKLAKKKKKKKKKKKRAIPSFAIKPQARQKA
jgi:hypothetical protein